ncbi:hypothetical protein BABINDRAFT_160851 [Babjeviella inositovora NRRL Y-12698]|uniref:Uncharacterized protein n=1 Tax=Babjeviella inositovora NRRL Y-12698 TaxID=984486 RepID=A0A1E3QSC8_9ASCO|nr:uncharacterized protein BABINDRAFT_160851 [Babjeviella inositovora NRRL Y-12698]ODQ80591.1 hypothetical protein BABINDRAFT_160851 [Babjeviella inositovora NRRL Y-12698]
MNLGEATEHNEPEATPGLMSFLDLPVINSGSGLDLSSVVAANSRITTIGDFMNSNKKLDGLKKNTRNEPGSNVSRNSSKALQALSNKVRNDQRKKIQQNGGVGKPDLQQQQRGKRDTIANAIKDAKQKQKPLSGVLEKKPQDDYSDDEDELRNARSQRSVKKGSNLMFESKIKKRPF